MRQESIRELTQQARRDSFLARRAPIILAVVALFAGWTGARMTAYRTTSMTLDQALMAMRQAEDRGAKDAAAIAVKDEIVHALRALRRSGVHARPLIEEIAQELK